MEPIEKVLMTEESREEPGIETDARWIAPVRIAVHGTVALVLAVILQCLTTWWGLENGILGWHDSVKSLWMQRPVPGSSGGLRWLVADLLTVFPWSLAAFSRSPCLAPGGRITSSIRLILRLVAMTVFFNFFGQSVRLGGDLELESVRLVAASMVAYLPPMLAFLPGLVVFNRLKSGGPGAVLLILPLYFGFLVGARAMFEPTLYFQADQVLLFPPLYEQRMDVLGPMLGIWGVLTMIELRCEATGRRLS